MAEECDTGTRSPLPMLHPILPGAPLIVRRVCNVDNRETLITRFSVFSSSDEDEVAKYD